MSLAILSTVESRLTAFSLLFTSALGLFGCEARACTDIGCVSGVAVQLSTELPEGEYELEVATEDGVDGCSFAVTDRGTVETNDCEVLQVPSFGDALWLSDQPKWIELSIEHPESMASIEGRFDLNYSVSRPNGEHCGPVCRSAGATMDTSDFAEAVLAYMAMVNGGAGGGGASATGP